MPYTCFECHARFDQIGPQDQFQPCEACGHGIPFKLRPLVVVTGADGVGKSALVPRLARQLDDVVVLDKDLLFGPWEDSHEYGRWLRIAFGLAAGGRSLLLLGHVRPRDIDDSPWRSLVESVYWCLLDCSDETRIQRVRGRPKSADIGYENLRSILDRAQQLRDEVPPYAKRLWTDGREPDAVADDVRAWIASW